MRPIVGLICLSAWLISGSALAAEDPSSFVYIKRPAMWVKDLDRTIVFYRDVLGFTVFTQGKLDLKQDSVLFGLHNVDPSAKVRRAIFSSSVEKHALFVMETEDGPEYAAGEKRLLTLVIRTDDLESVEARAMKHGFAIGNSNVDVSMTNGSEFRETVLFGPSGQAVLVYEAPGVSLD